MIKKMPTAKTGITTRKIMASWGLILKVSTQAQISMMGQRTATRMIIMNAICTLVTSVVRRVMIPPVENLSMLEKEKFWTLRYISRRRFREKPVEARAAKRPDSVPNTSATSAMPTSSPPYRRILLRFPASMPLSMS